MAFRYARKRPRAPDRTLDLSPPTGRNLFFRVFLSCVSDSRPHRSARDSFGRQLSSRRGPIAWLLATPVVCPYPALVFEQFRDVERDLLGGHARVFAAGLERMAARHAGY